MSRMLNKWMAVFLSALLLCTSFGFADDELETNPVLFDQFLSEFKNQDLDVGKLNEYKIRFQESDLDSQRLYMRYMDALVRFKLREFAEGYSVLEELLPEIDPELDSLLYREVLNNMREVSWYFWDIDDMLEVSISLKEWAVNHGDKHALILADYTLADVYYYFYDNKNALKLMDEGLTIAMENQDDVGIAGYYYFHGDMHYYAEEYEEASESYEKAMKYAEEVIGYPITVSLSEMIQNRLAETLAYLGRYEEAEAMIDRLIQKTPKNASYRLMMLYHTKGVVKLQSNKLDEAIEALNKGLGHTEKTSEIEGAEPYAIVIQTDLADAYYGNGDYKEAAGAYRIINDYYLYSDETSLEEAASELGDYEIQPYTEQLSLAEQLQESQAQALEVKKRNLIISNFAVLLLLVVMGLIIWDLKNKRKSQREIFIQSITDHLTNVFNRGRIIEIFEEHMNENSAVILMDVDDFKPINDTYGHVVGDTVLRRIAEVTKESIRSQDYIGRYGGEEFLVVLSDCDRNTASDIAERIRANIEAIEWPYENLKTTASLGGVISRGSDSDDVLHNADMRMYEAKRKGKNCVVFD